VEASNEPAFPRSPLHAESCSRRGTPLAIFRSVSMRATPFEVSPPFPLLFVVLPTILHQETAEQIARTLTPSGLRGFAAKFSDSTISKQDLLLGLHTRVQQWRPLSLDSLRMALATRLIHLNDDGTVVALSQTPARGSVPPSVSQMLKEADKFGFWCGQLSLHEIATLLRIRF
jgi:hypothetical protein